jgi:hypothetical protein
MPLQTVGQRHASAPPVPHLCSGSSDDEAGRDSGASLADCLESELTLVRSGCYSSGFAVCVCGWWVEKGLDLGQAKAGGVSFGRVGRHHARDACLAAGLWACCWHR